MYNVSNRISESRIFFKSKFLETNFKSPISARNLVGSGITFPIIFNTATSFFALEVMVTVLLNFPTLFSGKNRTLIKPFWDGLMIPVDQPGIVQPQEVSTSISFKGLSPVFENMKTYSTEPSFSLIFPKSYSDFSKEIIGSE